MGKKETQNPEVEKVVEQIERVEDDLQEQRETVQDKPSAQGRIEKRIVGLEVELKRLNQKLAELLEMENEPEPEPAKPAAVPSPAVDDSGLII